MNELTRRKFIKGGLATAGVAALGYLGYACGFGPTGTQTPLDIDEASSDPRWAKDVSKTFGGDSIAVGLSTAG